MKNSSINLITSCETSFGGPLIAAEGSFEKLNPRTYFQYAQHRIATVKF